MLSIYKKEIRAFFDSLIAYIVIGIFLVVLGLYLWVIPDTVFDLGVADLSLLFAVCPYVFLFLIPAITMRSFAEEKKAGTLELLLTHPITEWQLIGGKMLASFTVVLLSLLPTVVFYYSVYQLGNPVGNIDTAAVIGSYIGLLLLGAVLSAVGTFSSSVTDNQIISFVLSMFLGWLLYEGVAYLGEMIAGGTGLVISELSLSQQYFALSKGVLTLKNIIYLLSVCFFFVAATRVMIQKRKW